MTSEFDIEVTERYEGKEAEEKKRDME